MSQYTELKDLINAQAAKIADLQNINRQLVAVVQTTMIYDCIDSNMPEWARTAVQAAMDYGALVGDEQGRLSLSYKDLRAIYVNIVADCMISSFEGGVLPPLFFCL